MFRSASQPTAVIAIDVGGTKIDIAVADEGGDVLDQIRLATKAAAGPDQALSRVRKAVADLRERAMTGHERTVTGYAAVFPGVIQRDRLRFAPNLPGWDEFPLVGRLCHELDVDAIAVSNDIRAAALAELRLGQLRDVDPGVYVNLGTGVSAALTIHNTIVSGAHDVAGEIGYVSPGPGIPQVTEGRAPLEELVGGRALGERASAVLGVPVSAAELFARTDPASRQLVHDALGSLANVVANITVFLDPARIVFGGGMMASADVVLPVLSAHLRHAVLVPPEIRAARFTADAALHGAIQLALDAATPPLDAPAATSGAPR